MGEEFAGSEKLGLAHKVLFLGFFVMILHQVFYYAKGFFTRFSTMQKDQQNPPAESQRFRRIRVGGESPDLSFEDWLSSPSSSDPICVRPHLPSADETPIRLGVGDQIV